MRDIANTFSDAYSKGAPKLFGNMHRFLLDTLESHFQRSPDGNLLVLGPGRTVLPYSCQYTPDGKLGESNKQRIKSIIGDGRIVLLDYVSDGLEEALQTLETTGFFDENYFKAGLTSNENFDVEQGEKGSISFLVNNLRDDLKIGDCSIDAADGTLSIHHASVTRQELNGVYEEIFRILKPGGLLHLGEGQVDMNYSEDKLIRIGQDLSSLLASLVRIVDEREKDNGYVVNSVFEPGKSYSGLPVINDINGSYTPIRITGEGMVVIKATAPDQVALVDGKSEVIAQQLNEKGYKQMFVFSDSIVIPLIDPEMPEDVVGQMVPQPVP